MGIIQALRYEVPRPNALQRGAWVISSSRPGSWVFARSLHHMDKAILARHYLNKGSEVQNANYWYILIYFADFRLGYDTFNPLLGGID